MTVHARSDLASVSVSAAHGGCGVTHIRPAPGGNPQVLWSLDCPACEDYLRSDPLWSDTVAELPETYDEQKAREDFDKRGVTDERALMAMALAKMTGLELPETLAARITGHKAHIPLPQPVNCPAGHANLPGAKFCNECGQPVGDTTPAANVTVTSPGLPPVIATESANTAGAPPSQNGHSAAPEATESPALPPLPSNTKMRGMKREELATLAAGAGLSAEGSRAEVLDRLIAANNASKAPGGV